MADKFKKQDTEQKSPRKTSEADVRQTSEVYKREESIIL